MNFECDKNELEVENYYCRAHTFEHKCILYQYRHRARNLHECRCQRCSSLPGVPEFRRSKEY